MSWLSELGDRCNPILVREVRQATRSRVFTGSFVSLIVLAVVLTCLLLADHLEPRAYNPSGWEPGPFGGILFQGMFGCLLLALLGFVPLSAFMAMSEEWNQRTWEQLSLSELTPWRIVRGRMQASLVQAVLFSSALVPFLAASFLLRGLDLNVVLLGLVWAAVWSPALTLLAIVLGSFAGPRQVRMVLMVALLAAATGLGILMATLMEEIVDRPSVFAGPEFRWAMVSFLIAAILVAAYSAVGACALLTHPLENRSTPLRVLTFLVMLIGLGVIAVMYDINPESAGPYLVAIGALFAFWVPAALFSTEAETLSRRVAGKVSENRLVALVTAPFYPGGGRGYLFLLLGAATFASSAAAMFYFMDSRSTALPRIGIGCLLGAALSISAFTGIPAALFSRYTSRQKFRLLAFLSIVLLAFLGTTGHLSYYSYYRNDQPPWILINPFSLAAVYWEASWPQREALRPLFMILLGLVGVAVTFNFSRMLRGVREILVASAAARAKYAIEKGGE